MADIYIIKEQKDSAYKYVKISNDYLDDLNTPAYKAMVKRMDGIYNFKQKNYEIAINRFKSAQNYNYQEAHVDPSLFDLLAKSYSKLGKQDSANFYWLKYTAFGQENKFRTIRNNETLSLINESKQNKLEDDKIFYFGIAIGVILVFILIIYFIERKKMIKKAKYKSLLNIESSSDLQNIIHLAKENSPNLLTEFNHIYTSYQTDLQAKCPGLTKQEIVFSIYLLLDFSTKEISNYTFSSVRTIQNKKYRLRKKLNIDSDSDINSWFIREWKK